MERGIKKGVNALILIILLSSLVSADIIFTQQVKPVYSWGDSIYIPVTIKSLNDVSGIFEMNLICNGTLVNFYKNGVKLIAGEEKSMDSSLVLINTIIQGNKGICKVKASLNEEYQLSEEFKISSWLNIDGRIDGTEFDSGEGVWIIGEVKRESGENSNGFVDVTLITNNQSQNVTQSGTINNGILYMNFSLPTDLKAGNYFVDVNSYEKDSEGFVTNNGFAEYNLSVRQVPTSLELVIENKEINPGEVMRVKAILHDQTGDSINTTAYITLKDSTDKIIEQTEVSTDIFFEYPVSSIEPPAEWKVHGVSKKLESEDKFKINTKESADIKIVNKTIFITNVGNVIYNRTLLVKIGETPLNIQAELDIGETKRYILSAPDGDYQVKIATGDGSEINETLSLTGHAISIKEAGNFSTFAWILFIVLALIALLFILKRLRKRKSSGQKIMPSFFHFKKKEPRELPTMKEDSISVPVNKAEISLSVKGNQQEASIVCLKLKNLEGLDKKGSVGDTIKKIKEIAEENKAITYDNRDYLLFILTPTKTRNSKNEKSALDIAEQIQKTLSDHNRMFNQKVEYGISLNNGELIGQVENDTFKFMGMGSWMTTSKRLASLSNEEILLGESINNSLAVNIRTEKEMREGTQVHVLKSVKRDNEEARKFINKFLNRQEKK